MSVVDHPPTHANTRMNPTLKWVLIGVAAMFLLPFVATFGLIILLAVVGVVGTEANQSFNDVSAQLHATPVKVVASESIKNDASPLLTINNDAND